MRKENYQHAIAECLTSRNWRGSCVMIPVRNLRAELSYSERNQNFEVFYRLVYWIVCGGILYDYLLPSNTKLQFYPDWRVSTFPKSKIIVWVKLSYPTLLMCFYYNWLPKKKLNWYKFINWAIEPSTRSVQYLDFIFFGMILLVVGLFRSRVTNCAIFGCPGEWRKVRW